MSLLEPTDVLAAVAAASSCGFLVNGLRAGCLRRRLRTDALTGLANRTGLHHAFTRTRRRSGHCVAALMIDLDDFKTINDTHGHRLGDQVLTEVARRLRTHQRRGQLAVRISGDEFVLWLGALPDSPAAWIRVEEIARQVTADIAAPMQFDGQSLVVTASVGAGITTAETATLEELLEPADHAMYGHKPRRRTRSVTEVPARRREGSA